MIIAALASFTSAQPTHHDCRREAEQISGYRVSAEESSVLGGALKGGLGGAALGAAGGWALDRDAKKAAKRTAALGVLIGGARAASRNRDLDRKRDTYQRALDACLDRVD